MAALCSATRARRATTAASSGAGGRRAWTVARLAEAGCMWPVWHTQIVLRGVGNVYRAEVLFRLGLDPQLPGKRLRRDQCDAVWADLVGLLRAGYEVGKIETLRPEHDPTLRPMDNVVP